MRGLIWAAAKAFVIALVLTPITRDIFRAYNVVDRPGRRKVHAYPIPRVGGIPIAIAFAIALLSFKDFDRLDPTYESPIWKLLPGAAVIFLTGLIDDFFNLRPLVKLSGQVIAAVTVFSMGIRIDTIAGLPLPAWLSFLLTLGWILLTTNALNLIDGLDGLCGGISFLATCTFFAAGWYEGNLALMQITLPLAGALLGFLCFNFNPATVFLGDSGALLIGFLLGCYGLVWTEKAGTVWGLAVPLLALTVPLMDVLLSIARRYLRQQPIFGADRGHIHHKLLERGLSTRGAVLTLYCGAAIAAAFAMCLSHPDFHRYQPFILAGFCVTASVGVRELRYPEFEVAGRLLFRGEFKRALEEKVRMEQLAAALEHSNTEEEWWKVLSGAARDAGWIRLRLSGPHGFRDYDSSVVEAAVWSFTIVLADDETLRIDGPVHEGNAVDLISLAGIVKHSYSRKRSAWGHQPALS